MLPSFCTTEVTRLRASMVSTRGTYERDWTNPDTLKIKGCSIQLQSRDGDLSDRTNSVTGYILYAPVGADVKLADRISDGANIYTVNEEPYTWESPTGAVSHLIAHLEVYRG